MEKIIEVNKIKSGLDEYLEEVKKGEIFVISSRSKPKGVLLSYSKYEELKDLVERAKQLEASQMLSEFREKAARAGITEADVKEEIEKVRTSCGQ